MLSPRLSLIPLFLSAASLFAHDIITTKLTYTRDISRIFAKRCIACHASDASIPLTSYQEVRPWAVDIKQQVLSRQMPPWGAVKGFGEFTPDDGLSQEELLIIAAWVLGGAPEGDPKLLPHSDVKPSHAAPEAPLRNVLVIDTRNTLERPLTLAAIKPLPETPLASTRVTVSFPDGHIEPLLWLFQYDSKWNRTFRFRQPISLPAGTVIHADSPLRFALQANE
ncbi:MAG TPA: cytochrome c [Bryobacteraceae bacterium]|nr:cytochrome c [Bryobacteraceae bacterium]